jgi:hypothetical protein
MFAVSDRDLDGTHLIRFVITAQARSECPCPRYDTGGVSGNSKDPPAFLRNRIEITSDVTTQTKAAFVEEVLAVYPAEIDASLVAKRYDAAGFRDVLRYPKRGRKIISRSHRKDADWQLELYQSFENSIESTVATTDDDPVDLAAAITKHGRQTIDRYIGRVDHIDAQSGERGDRLGLVFAPAPRTRVHV